MKKFRIIVIILVTVFILLLLYNKLAFLNILVKFDSLEPFERQMSVYYKGFKIGQTTKIYPDKDYKNTYLKLRLYRGKINLPKNSTVKIRKVKTGSYVDMLYPQEPVLMRLRNNDEIKGVIAKDINSALDGKFTDEDIDLIVDDAADLIQNANNSIKSLNDILSEITGIIRDIRPDIKSAVLNLNKTSDNLRKSSESLNNAIAGNQAQVSFSNITETTENIKLITENLDSITKQIDEISIPITNDILCETRGTMHNVNEMTDGINNTLKKHFGLGRFLFGKPVNGN